MSFLICEKNGRCLDEDCPITNPNEVCYHAIEVDNVYHGKWIWKTEDKYECINCGKIVHVDEVMGIPQYLYCPYCGSQMDSDKLD